jgi:hypothetical protein
VCKKEARDAANDKDVSTAESFFIVPMFGILGSRHGPSQVSTTATATATTRRKLALATHDDDEQMI